MYTNVTSPLESRGALKVLKYPTSLPWRTSLGYTISTVPSVYGRFVLSIAFTTILKLCAFFVSVALFTGKIAVTTTVVFVSGTGGNPPPVPPLIGGVVVPDEPLLLLLLSLLPHPTKSRAVDRKVLRALF